jgi:hypothetical protein
MCFVPPDVKRDTRTTGSQDVDVRKNAIRQTVMLPRLALGPAIVLEMAVFSGLDMRIQKICLYVALWSQAIVTTLTAL